MFAHLPMRPNARSTLTQLSDLLRLLRTCCGAAVDTGIVFDSHRTENVELSWSVSPDVDGPGLNALEAILHALPVMDISLFNYSFLQHGILIDVICTKFQMSTGIIRSKQYNRTLNLGGAKPSQMTHVRVGGWAEVYVGEEPLHESRVVFGYIEAIIGEQIQLRIADTVFSAEETGLANGDLLDLELGDVASSEFSPAVQESKTRLRRRARRRCSA